MTLETPVTDMLPETSSSPCGRRTGMPLKSSPQALTSLYQRKIVRTGAALLLAERISTMSVMSWISVGRWDAAGIVEELFSVEEQWHPQAFFVEDGVIWKTLWPFIRAEMQKRDIWINFIPLMSVKDKAARGRAFQKRMKAG